MDFAVLSDIARLLTHAPSGRPKVLGQAMRYAAKAGFALALPFIYRQTQLFTVMLVAAWVVAAYMISHTLMVIVGFSLGQFGIGSCLAIKGFFTFSLGGITLPFLRHSA